MEKIKRSETGKLFQHTGLTEKQLANSRLNREESEKGETEILSFPRRIVLELTSACNLNCITCGRSHADFPDYFLDIRLLDACAPALEYAEEVTLMGWGEPTVHPDFAYFLSFLNKYPVKKYLLTNGLTLEAITPLLFEQGVDILAVSLDGPDSKTNDVIRAGMDFEKITRSIRKAAAAREGMDKLPYINTVTTLMKQNLEAFPRMIDLAADMGIEEVKGVYFTSFSKKLREETLFDIPEKTEEIFKRAAEKAAEHNILLSLPRIPGKDPAGDACHAPCHLAWRDFFLGCDGIIRTCMSSSNTLTPVGAGEGFSFEETWNSMEFQDFRKRVKGPEEGMNPSCRRCYQSSCANWNKRHAYIQDENIFHPAWGSNDE